MSKDTKKKKFELVFPKNIFRIFVILKNLVKQITDFFQSLDDEIEDLKMELQKLKDERKKK